LVKKVYFEGHQDIKLEKTYNEFDQLETLLHHDYGSLALIRNAFGEIEKKMHNQVSELYEYDFLGRLIERTENDGKVAQWTYDTKDFGVGQPAIIQYKDNLENVIHSVDFIYDQLSRNTSTIESIDGESYDIHKIYDSYSRVNKIYCLSTSVK